MGNNISVSDDVNLISHIMFYDNKETKYSTLRGKSSKDEIAEIKSDILDKIEMNESKQLCCILCNSYDKTNLSLGDSALNDGILTYYTILKRDYKPYLYHDPTNAETKHIITKFLKLGCDKLIVYFIGHGKRIVTNDKIITYMQCVDGNDISNTEITQIVLNNNTAKKLTLISDCCHSGSVYDIESREDIITIAACQDTQSSKQDYINHRGNGVFTYYFWKYSVIENDINDALELKVAIDKKTKAYRQECKFNFLTENVL